LNKQTGAVIWSRNVSALDPPNQPLNVGATGWTSSILSGGFIYFTQETGWVYKLDAATGLDAAGSPLQLPDVVNGKVPYNALTSDGTKLWVGDADGIGTDGSIYQIDMATFTIDWQLTNPSYIFTGDVDFYEPEGFPGSMAYEDGILYYHSLVRDDASGFSHFPQTGVLGAIDVTVEDGSGNGVLWVNPASTNPLAAPGTVPSSYNYSGPAVGPEFVYTTSRGFFGGTTEPDGVAAWSKTFGVRIWYHGYTNLGNLGGVAVLDDVRCPTPATVFCGPDNVEYLFTSHVDGYLRLFNGFTGDAVWRRPHTGRQRGTAMIDDAIVTLTRNGGPLTGGGSITYKEVGVDPRPRLQIDSQYVFRTASPGDAAATDNVVGAIQNTGCVTLNVTNYDNQADVPPPTAARVSNVNPMLSRAAQSVTRNLAGYDAMLSASSKSMAIAKTALDIDDNYDESLVRTFARHARTAVDPLFLTAVTGPATVAAGASADLTITYDETGLTNNTGYLNYIEYVTDDPDYWEQDLTGTLLVPFTTVNLFIGCPDAFDLMTIGRGTAWITNWGAESGGEGNFAEPDATDQLTVDGSGNEHYDGGWYAAVNNDVHWAFEGCSVGGYPRRGGEWGPTLPCGVTINALSFNSPFDGSTQSYEEVSFNMIDLSSPNGFFPPSLRQLGGVGLAVQKVGSADPAFGNFMLTKITLTNESGDFTVEQTGLADTISGTMDSILFGVGTDWDVGSGNNWMYKFSNGYTVHDGSADGSAANTAGGHARLDADHHAVGAMGSGGAPTFMMGDILNDQAHGDAPYEIMNDPQAWADAIDIASTFNTDIGAYWTLGKFDALADGASEEFYMGIFLIHNDGVYESWTTAAEYEAVVANTVSKMKAYAGLGAGDVNLDGVIDLADVVRLGNIIDGSFDPTGTGGEFAGDCDGDGDIDEDDYNLLYDVVSGVGGTLVEGWRF
jgi:hypothetical protein